MSVQHLATRRGFSNASYYFFSKFLTCISKRKVDYHLHLLLFIKRIYIVVRDKIFIFPIVRSDFSRLTTLTPLAFLLTAPQLNRKAHIRGHGTISPISEGFHFPSMPDGESECFRNSK